MKIFLFILLLILFMYYLNMNESFISASQANNIYSEQGIEYSEKMKDDFLNDIKLFNRASEILKCN